MPDAIRAKFYVNSVTQHSGGVEEAHLSPVTSGSEENKSFSRWTPSGKLDMQITNPGAQGFFQPGKEYYLDITPAESAQPAD
jgi:hypothetical protein